MQELEKWRLILGGNENDGTGVKLSEGLEGMDEALAALYEFDGKFDYANSKGGSEGSSPKVSRWLGDIRKYFPNTVVEVMQKDAMKIPQLKDKMMFEPEILAKAQPDINLVATLMELGKLIPEKTKETARIVIRKVVDDLMAKLEQKTISAISGALDKSSRNNRPRYAEVNWNATIQKNLKHYQPEYKTIIPERLIGYGKKSKKSLKDIVMCIDQSGSMGSSVVYSAIFGAVMASLPNVKTKMVVFDTQVVDLTEQLKDPVEVLFGVQLGGGTDIHQALTYCQSLITKPFDTIMVMITDLEEGGNSKLMIERTQEIIDSGVQVICLLALNDDGSPYYDKNHAKIYTEMGIPVFACSPDKFPELMAAAIQKQDIFKWLGDREIVRQG